jgi:transposase InsO family protein
MMSGPPGSRPPLVDADRVAGLRSLATSKREIETMFANIVTAVKHKVAGWVQAAGNLLERITKPTNTAARLVAGAGRDMTRSTVELLAENALLRQQIIVLRRAVDKPRLEDHERLLMVLLARINAGWRQAVHIVKPDTLLRWHSRLFKLLWKRKSKPKGQPARLAQETIDLIRMMRSDNRWGAERIRGELLKLGIRVSKRTVQKYMCRVREPGEPGGQTWSIFLANHAGEIWACDFLQLYDVLFRPLFALFFVKHGNREVVHLNVTRSPTDAWSTQQLREATPFGEAPRYLIRDNDCKFGPRFAAVAEAANIDIVDIPPHSPNCNAIVERFLRSARNECLDHVVILGEDHARRVLREYAFDYFNTARPHQGIDQKIPKHVDSGIKANIEGRVIARPILGGLQHDYRWAA